MSLGQPLRRRVLFTLAVVSPLLTSCNNGDTLREAKPSAPDKWANFAHLEHLAETVGLDEPRRIIHIYANAPNYEWVGDDDEGIACVDDAARAAVVYLRDFELNGSTEHRETAEELIRFILYMQDESGLFYNFVLDNQLTINKTHPHSRVDEFDWWSARAVWALGTAARVLKTANPALSRDARDAVKRTYPHLSRLLEQYGTTRPRNGRDVPTWLVRETAADATSELLLGLHAANQAYPDPELSQRIDRLADGIDRMQWGTMARFPWSAHASWIDDWHGWGNSQTQALSEIGRLKSAVTEAENFYPRLLIDGWMHSFHLDDSTSVRTFEQIAYAVRCVSVGLVRLYQATGDERYAVMAGLAASWFTGNNVAGVEMYDPATGRGYDGINSEVQINRNSGAESTIEALYTMIEIDALPVAKRWAAAHAGRPQMLEVEGKKYLYKVFSTGAAGSETRAALVMNLTDEKLNVLFDSDIEPFFSGQIPK